MIAGLHSRKRVVANPRVNIVEEIKNVIVSPPSIVNSTESRKQFIEKSAQQAAAPVSGEMNLKTDQVKIFSSAMNS